jgi:hypothetical protein
MRLLSSQESWRAFFSCVLEIVCISYASPNKSADGDTMDEWSRSILLHWRRAHMANKTARCVPQQGWHRGTPLCSRLVSPKQAVLYASPPTRDALASNAPPHRFGPNAATPQAVASSATSSPSCSTTAIMFHLLRSSLSGHDETWFGGRTPMEKSFRPCALLGLR